MRYVCHLGRSRYRRVRRSRVPAPDFQMSLFTYAEDEIAAAATRERYVARLIDDMLNLQQRFVERGAREYLNAGAYEPDAILLAPWEIAPLDDGSAPDPNRITASDLQPSAPIATFHSTGNRSRGERRHAKLTAVHLNGAFDAFTRHVESH